MPLKTRPDGKKDTGRPNKAVNFINAMSEVLNEEGSHNAIIMTDEELFLLANEKLEEGDRICYTTFKNYKNSKNDGELGIYNDFLSVYKKAITIQKKSLFDGLKKDQSQRQRWAWIIERKFGDWNLKKIQEISGVDGGPINLLSFLADNASG